MSTKPNIARSSRCRSGWLETLKSQGIKLEQGHYPNRVCGLTAYSLFESSESSELTLLLHGTGNDHLFSLQPLIEALLANGQSVLSIDLPGHGTESSSILQEESFWTAAEDLQVYLKGRGFDQRNLNAIGYSLGGVFLLNALEHEQLMFKRVVLMAVPLHARVSLNFIWQELLSPFSPSFWQQIRLYGWSESIPAFGRFRRADFPIRLEATISKSYPEFVGGLLKARPPLSLSQKLGHNCLLIAGDRDRLAPPSDSVHWLNTAPKLKVAVIERANHFLLPFQKKTINAITHWIQKSSLPIESQKGLV